MGNLTVDTKLEKNPSATIGNNPDIPATSEPAPSLTTPVERVDLLGVNPEQENTAHEQVASQEQQQKSDQKEIETIQPGKSPAPVSAVTPVSNESEEVKEIEGVLSEGLEDFFVKLDAEAQQQFKSQGEDTARAINVLMKKTKVKVKEIVQLIVKWLKIIPGVNKFFVEQQAKIKTDQLIDLKRKR